MNENLYTEIIGKITPILTGSQLGEISGIIKSALCKYDVISTADERENTQHSNRQLLDTFISAKRVEGCSDKTLEVYRNYLSFWIKDFVGSILNATTNDMRLYLAHLQSDRKNTNVSVDNHRRILSSFFRWLEEEDFVKKSPMRRIHKIRQMKAVKEPFSEDELEILRSNCDNLRDLAIIEFLVSTGVRIGELVGLNIKDIDFEKRQCVVLGKGNKQRIVYFSTRAKIRLLDYLKERKDDSDALFVALNPPHNRLLINGIESRLRNFGNKLGIRVHPHRFRRTLATRALDRGMPIEQVQHMLGHSKLDTTLIYVKVEDSNVEHSHHKYID